MAASIYAVHLHLEDVESFHLDEPSREFTHHPTEPAPRVFRGRHSLVDRYTGIREREADILFLDWEWIAMTRYALDQLGHLLPGDALRIPIDCPPWDLEAIRLPVGFDALPNPDPDAREALPTQFTRSIQEHIFSMQYRFVTPVFCDEEFVAAAVDAGINGVKFLKIWSDDPPFRVDRRLFSDWYFSDGETEGAIQDSD